LKNLDSSVDNPAELQAAANGLSPKGSHMSKLVTKKVQKDSSQMISHPQGAFTGGSVDLLSNPTPVISHGYPMKISL
jgi:hypothetical protein